MSTSSSIPPSSSFSTIHPAAASSSASSSKNQLYSLASHVPLIKSHSISLPKPVKLPPDLHPLPADISAYFVYPFSLESYVLDANTPSSSTVDELLAKHQRYLEQRQRQMDDRQREMLRKVAPGWSGDVLLPTSSKAGAEAAAGAVPEEVKQQEQRGVQQQQERTPLDDLADHLAQLDALSTSAAAGSRPHHYP